MKKNLCKVEAGRKLFGVCGGVARYLGVDPTVVRILTVISVFAFGVTIPVYIIAAVLMPEEGEFT
jgi:phage shock protein C